MYKNNALHFCCLWREVLISLLYYINCLFGFTQLSYTCTHNFTLVKQKYKYPSITLFPCLEGYHSKKNICPVIQITMKLYFICLKAKCFEKWVNYQIKMSQSVFSRLLLGSLLCELESSENPSCAEKSVGPWESLTIEKPVKSIIINLENLSVEKI